LVTLGRGDALRLAGVEFRQPVDPVWIGPVRGAGIDQARSRVLDHGRGLARRVVGQAEHREIGGVEHLGARRGVFACVFRQAQELDIGAPFQAFADLQSGGADLAIDENLRRICAGSGFSRGHRLGPFPGPARSGSVPYAPTLARRTRASIENTPHKKGVRSGTPLMSGYPSRS
jgi:hypothetical protein